MTFRFGSRSSGGLPQLSREGYPGNDSMKIVTEI